MTAGGPLPKTSIRTRINAVKNINISLAVRLLKFIKASLSQVFISD